MSQKTANEFEDDIERIRDALNRPGDRTQAVIAEMGTHIVATLLRKNVDYGASAFKVPMLAPEVSPSTGIRVRLSDKLERYLHLADGTKPEVAESILDTLEDTAGYFILLRVLEQLNKEQNTKEQD